MTPQRALAQLRHEVRARAPAAPPPDPPDPDGDQLARETTRAYLDELARYRRVRAAEPEILNPDDPPEWWELDAIRAKLPEKVSFADLNRLSQADPEAVPVQWDVLKATARDDLARGWLAARDLEHEEANAWERACFLAVRDRLRRAWLPQNGIEAQLIDEMAQYEMMRRRWVEVLGRRSRDPQILANQKAAGQKGDERTQTAVGATTEAGRMLERLQRLYQNAVRLLIHLRRGPRTTVIQQSSQINITTGPQVNVVPTAETVVLPADPDPARGAEGLT
jgi:hypothetical protein